MFVTKPESNTSEINNHVILQDNLEIRGDLHRGLRKQFQVIYINDFFFYDRKQLKLI